MDMIQYGTEEADMIYKKVCHGYEFEICYIDKVMPTCFSYGRKSSYSEIDEIIAYIRSCNVSALKLVVYNYSAMLDRDEVAKLDYTKYVVGYLENSSGERFDIIVTPLYIMNRVVSMKE